MKKDNKKFKSIYNSEKEFIKLNAEDKEVYLFLRGGFGAK